MAQWWSNNSAYCARQCMLLWNENIFKDLLVKLYRFDRLTIQLSVNVTAVFGKLYNVSHRLFESFWLSESPPFFRHSRWDIENKDLPSHR